MWPLKQTVKGLIKRGSFLQAGLNNATVYFQPGIRHLSPARNPTPTGRVCFIFMILGLFQRVVISLLVAGGKGGTVPTLGALGRGQMERKAAPEEATLLELRANGPHQSLSSLNALKGEEMECAVYRSNTHLSVPQDSLRRAGVRANKLWLRGSKYCRTHISQY